MKKNQRGKKNQFDLFLFRRRLIKAIDVLNRGQNGGSRIIESLKQFREKQTERFHVVLGLNKAICLSSQQATRWSSHSTGYLFIYLLFFQGTIDCVFLFAADVDCPIENDCTNLIGRI